MSFKADLSFGKTWEDMACALMGGAVERAPEGKFKPYDFISNGVKVEVKADRLAYKYGSKTMFIEFECSDKPSGLSTTEADVWFYFMVHPTGSWKAYMYSVAELKSMCEGCIVKKGGDGWRSRGYIVPVKTSAHFEGSAVLGQPSQDLRIRLPPPSPLVPHDQRTPGNTSPLSPLPRPLLVSSPSETLQNP